MSRPYRAFWPETPDMLRRFAFQSSNVLGSNVSFGSTMSNTDQDQNMQCWKATGTSPVGADTEFPVPHLLGRVPITVFWLLDRAGDIYRSTTAWTATTIYLKCSVSMAVYTIIIV